MVSEMNVNIIIRAGTHLPRKKHNSKTKTPTPSKPIMDKRASSFPSQKERNLKNQGNNTLGNSG